MSLLFRDSNVMEGSTRWYQEERRSGGGAPERSDRENCPGSAIQQARRRGSCTVRHRTVRGNGAVYPVHMSTTRILGVIFLIAGVVLIVIGATASRSLADNLSSLFSGHLTQTTMWYIFGGIASAVVGLLLATGAIGRARP